MGYVRRRTEPVAEGAGSWEAAGSWEIAQAQPPPPHSGGAIVRFSGLPRGSGSAPTLAPGWCNPSPRPGAIFLMGTQ